MADIELLLETAINEEGYLEKSESAYKSNHNVLDSKIDGAGNSNYTKYARDLGSINYFNSNKQGVAWCAVFVSWCFYKAFGKEKALQLQCQPSSGNCGAGCSSAAGYYKTKGQFYTDPNPGDQIFFKSSTGSGYGHTGIVERVENNIVYTIEGNTSSSNDVVSNGGAVRRKSYDIKNAKIAGYGRPKWEILQNNTTNNKTEDNINNNIKENFDEYKAKVVATNGSTVNLRKTTSENSTILTKVSVGKYVTVKCYIDDKWAHVSYIQNENEITGYMMRKFLEKVSDKSKLDESTVSKLNNIKTQLSQIIVEISNILREVET